MLPTLSHRKKANIETFLGWERGEVQPGIKTSREAPPIRTVMNQRR